MTLPPALDGEAPDAPLSEADPAAFIVLPLDPAGDDPHAPETAIRAAAPSTPDECLPRRSPAGALLRY